MAMNFEQLIGQLKELRTIGVRGAAFDESGLTEVEFFPLEAETVAVPADAVAKALAELGPEEKMPSDTEMMMWSTGGPMPEVKATPQEDPTT
jgi:hypothetical protein